MLARINKDESLYMVRVNKQNCWKGKSLNLLLSEIV